MSVFAQRVKSRREELGINQHGLAVMTEISQAQISRYEKGDSEPTATAIVALAQVLNTSTDWLLGVTAEHPQQTEGLTELEARVLRFFRSKSPERQPIVAEIMRLA